METELQAMLQLAPDRDGWKPRIVRTVATENKGVGELALAVQQYREHFRAGTRQQDRKLEHWKRRLLALAEDMILRRTISGAAGEGVLDALAREVAGRKKDPYAAARELLAHADASRKSG
jgi:LAO/AO transport system kinase